MKEVLTNTRTEDKAASSGNELHQNTVDPRSFAQLKDGGRATAHKWIGSAIKHPGALHRALGVPEGEKIPAAKMAKASHSDNPHVRQMVGLAKTLKKMH